MLCCRAWESCACSASKAQRMGEEELACWELWSRGSQVASYCAQAALLAAVKRPKLQSPQEDTLVQHAWVVRSPWRRAARQREVLTTRGRWMLWSGYGWWALSISSSTHKGCSNEHTRVRWTMMLSGLSTQLSVN